MAMAGKARFACHWLGQCPAGGLIFRRVARSNGSFCVTVGGGSRPTFLLARPRCTAVAPARSSRPVDVTRLLSRIKDWVTSGGCPPEAPTDPNVRN